jgi:trehalose/maltose hydrolase-like predicted phosphorylase
MAGMFNRRTSRVGDRDIENEDFVNCPNWLPVSFRYADGAWMDPNQCRVVRIQRRLSFLDGLLSREMVVEDEDGRQTKILSSRVASMEDPHVAALKYTIQPMDYAGRISIRTSLDGDLINDGVARYRQLDQHHLEPVEGSGDGPIQQLLVRTNQSEVEIGLACRIRVLHGPVELKSGMDHRMSPGRVESEMNLALTKGESLTLEKLISIYNSRETGTGKVLQQALGKLDQLESFGRVQAGSAAAWKEIWK